MLGEIMKIHSHSRILVTYLAAMGLVATTLGGYVACGAQTYRVQVDNDTAALGASSVSSSNLAGVHSALGWKTHLPVHFRTSKAIPGPTVAQIQNAMNTWEAAVGRTLFVYEGEDPQTSSNFADLYAPLADGVNGHYFDPNWSAATKKPKGVLATAIWENDPRDPRSIAKSDIRYNSESYLFGNSIDEYSQGERTIVDMESLALHELGHVLGLGHVSTEEDRYSVMNPALFIGEGMITRNLSRGDLERIRSIYGIKDESMSEKLTIAGE
jgi:hypothetical protein